MATVYLARDLLHNRKVAIKVMNSELAAIIGAARFQSRASRSDVRNDAAGRHPGGRCFHFWELLPPPALGVLLGPWLTDVTRRQAPCRIECIGRPPLGVLRQALQNRVVERPVDRERAVNGGGHRYGADMLRDDLVGGVPAEHEAARQEPIPQTADAVQIGAAVDRAASRHPGRQERGPAAAVSGVARGGRPWAGWVRSKAAFAGRMSLMAAGRASIRWCAT